MIAQKCRLSVDGEMLGGVVSHFSMVELGACTIDAFPDMKTFGKLIKPTLGPNEPYEHGAKQVLRRSYQEFYDLGKDPRDVAHDFIDFCDEIRDGRELELHGVNISFDFAFIREYLYRYARDRYQVIGHKGYEILSYACGVFGLPHGSMSAKKVWEMIKPYTEIYEKYYPGELRHTASEDAIDQGKLLLALEEVNLFHHKAGLLT